ncbi:MAG: hypothetical protein ABIJ86_10400 [Spirochaetota bacterium]
MTRTNHAVQFNLEPVEDEKDTYFIANRASGLYLEPSADGNSIVQQLFTGADRQKWVFHATDPARFMAPPAKGANAVQALAGKKFWDFSGTYPAMRSGELQVWAGKPSSGAADRIIEIVGVDVPWHSISPRHLPRHVLAAPADGRLQTTLNRKTNEQLWGFEYAGSPNTYYIRNSQTNQVVDLNADRGNTDGPTQVFEFIYADGPNKGKLFIGE